MDVSKLCYRCFKNRDGNEVCSHCGYKVGDGPIEQNHCRPGTKLNDRYIIGTAVSFGGPSIIYRAWDTLLDVQVVTKEFFPNGLVTRIPGGSEVIVYSGSRRTQYEYGLNRFLLEARNMAKYNHHPNIFHLLDVFQSNNTAYSVMELLEGCTLKAFLNEAGGKLDCENALSIILPILDALAVIHKNNGLHRDVCPSNIFITLNNQMKLISFDLALFGKASNENKLTVIFNPGYAPPELYSSKGRQGPWTDIYALGATLYRMVTGVVPEESLDRLMEDTLQAPTILDPSIPPYISDIIMKAMSIKYRHRFSNVLRMKDALERKRLIMLSGRKNNSKAELELVQEREPDATNKRDGRSPTFESAKPEWITNAIKELQQLNLPQNTTDLKNIAQRLGSQCVFDRRSLLFQAPPLQMRIKVANSCDLAWCIRLAIEGAFAQMHASLPQLEQDGLIYEVFDYALPKEDSEPLRKSLWTLHQEYPWVQLHLYRKVVGPNELRREMSLGSPRMQPVFGMETIKGAISIPLDVTGKYTDGESEEEALNNLYTKHYAPLVQNLKERENVIAIVALDEVIAQAEKEIREDLNWVFKSEGTKLALEQWDVLTPEERFGHVLIVGQFGVRQSGSTGLVCVDFCEAIPACDALAILVLAQSSSSKKQLIDAGDGSDVTVLKYTLDKLQACDPEWEAKIF